MKGWMNGIYLLMNTWNNKCEIINDYTYKNENINEWMET